MIRRYLPKSIEELVRWYERYISPVGLVGGFIADNLFLTRRVDLLQTNALLITYLVVSGAGIVVLNLIESGRVRGERLLRMSALIPVAIQFSLGGLFSGFLSLYSRSASSPLSWIFVLIVAVLLIGNERVTRVYTRLTFQVALYFTVLFAYLIFFLPVVFHAIGPPMFLLSGGVALATVALFLMLLTKLTPERVQPDRLRIALSILGVYLVFNGLYFFGAIPPLPLALKVAGVYHSVVRESDGTYQLYGEQGIWYQGLLGQTVFHEDNGSPVYAYSAVFAPSGLTTTILHQWQRYDPVGRRWVTTDTLTFSIEGGRDGGFRGYSEKSNVAPGAWRVNVITSYGELIGRISFSVVSSTTTPTLAATGD